MKRVISASRRTDLVAFFPERLAGWLAEGRAQVDGPSGRSFEVDLRPEAVHTIVLWSKDFTNLLGDAFGLRRRLERYDQVYLLFTVTGLGGTLVERGVIETESALAMLPDLVAFARSPKRVSVRFDPIVYWRESGRLRTNLGRFAAIAERAARAGVEDIRLSFVQWYGKAVRRAARNGFDFADPAEEEKVEAAARLAETSAALGLRLHSCSQDFLTRVPGIRRSSCIDGRLLNALHPRREKASVAKDRSQREECGCTASLDIGSYAQSCPHACVYCYANPRV